MLSDEDQQVIRQIIKPIAEQCANQTTAVGKINHALETIKIDQAVSKEQLKSVNKHLQTQNGRLDKTEKKTDALEDICTQHASNWGWTRRIVLWAVSAGGLIGVTIAIMKLF